MNWQIIGHQNIIKFLENCIFSGRLSHAFLFYGQKQIGKKEVAKQFAKALLCYEGRRVGLKNKKDQLNIPCNSCENCIEFDKKTHADFYWLEKGKQDKNITVEQIRELRMSLASRSFFKSYKVAIISGAEFMSLSAANALLKTLEEPKGKTVIILIADKTETIPKTILSRTQKIKFLPVAKKDIYDYLLKVKELDRARALELSSISAGRPGRALLFAQYPEFWQRYILTVNNFFKLLSSKRHEKINFVANLFEDNKKLVVQVNTVLPLLNLWQLLLRDILLLKLSLSDKIINSRVTGELEKLEPFFNLNKIKFLNSRIEETKILLNQNTNPKLVLENLLLDF